MRPGQAAQIVHGFLHRCAVQLHAGQTDHAQLLVHIHHRIVQRLGEGSGFLRRFRQGNGHLPQLGDVRQGAAPGFIPGSVKVSGSGAVDQLHAAPRRRVVRVRLEDGGKFLQGRIILAQFIIAVSQAKQAVDFLHVLDVFRG